MDALVSYIYFKSYSDSKKKRFRAAVVSFLGFVYEHMCVQQYSRSIDKAKEEKRNKARPEERTFSSETTFPRKTPLVYYVRTICTTTRLYVEGKTVAPEVNFFWAQLKFERDYIINVIFFQDRITFMANFLSWKNAFS